MTAMSFSDNYHDFVIRRMDDLGMIDLTVTVTVNMETVVMIMIVTVMVTGTMK